MRTIAIMGNGPSDHIPNLQLYQNEIDLWIGADRGALTLIERSITVDYAVGDFDSINQVQRESIEHCAAHFEAYPAEKNQTDIEIALWKAFALKPDKIYLFGVTGGRLDHAFINIQLLYTIVMKDIKGVVIDQWNQLTLTTPGTYSVEKNNRFPHISFVPYTRYVKGLSLGGFYYSLEKKDISWGSTRCISNKLLSDFGTFSYEEGILLLIKSCDANSNANLM